MNIQDSNKMYSTSFGTPHIANVLNADTTIEIARERGRERKTETERQTERKRERERETEREKMEEDKMIKCTDDMYMYMYKARNQAGVTFHEFTG